MTSVSKIVFPVWMYLLLSAVCLNNISCTETHTTKTIPSAEIKKIKAPLEITAGDPFVTNTDTCLAPLTVTLPTIDRKQITIKTPNGNQQLTIVPPLVMPADFYVSMSAYNMDKGLSIDGVLSGYHDKDGNMWFGTLGGGVTRFDGTSSVTFTAKEGLGNNAVTDIAQDAEGNIWFALDGGGIAKYDGRSISNYGKAEGLLSSEVHSLVITKEGILFLATRKGISRFDGKSFFNYEAPESFAGKMIRSCVEDKEGNIWFVSPEHGISCFDGKDFKIYSTLDGLISNSVWSCFTDSKGRLWFGTNRGISMYDGKTFTNFLSGKGLPDYSITCIAEDKKGDMWFGTNGGGVSRFDGKSFVNFTTRQGLANNVVQSITQDKSGNLWIGTEGGGVSIYNGKGVINFSSEQGLADNIVRSIIEDRNGNFWFGTNNNGVSNYDGDVFTNYNRLQGLNNNRVHRILEDKKGDMWFCTNGGVTKFNGNRLQTFTTVQGLAHKNVRCIVEDRKGGLWFGTEIGLSKFDGKYFFNYTTAEGLPSNNVRDAVEDENGNIWLGTHEGGLSRFNGKTFLNLDTAQGLVDNYIFNLTMDSKGNLWICSGNGGISILRKEIRDELQHNYEAKRDTRIFENFTTNEGLANDVVYDAVEDKNGNMIIGTNLGFTVIKGGLSTNKPIAKEQIEYYNWKNGYGIKDVNTQAMYVDSKGIVWAGTSEKLVRFDYAAIHKNTDPQEVRIRSIKINYQDVSWYNLFSKHVENKNKKDQILSAMLLEESNLYGKAISKAERDVVHKKYSGIKFDSISRHYSVPINLKLPYKHNNVNIDFVAIEPARPFLVRYQYMLEGYDKGWSPVTDKSTASFGNIDEGVYTFQVKAMSPEGVWSKPISYQFEVLPPWYRTWFAYFIYAAALFSLVYILYKGRIRQIETKQAVQLETIIATQEEERKRISRDLHDDIGTKLSALKLFLTSLKTSVDKKQYQQVEELAGNSEQLINYTIKDVRNMLLNLSPGILEEFGFATAIESLVNQINQTKTVHFNLTMFGMNMELKKDYELTLYRITQELINNVLKHAEAKHVDLQIGYRNERIIIMIEDDGKGFDMSDHQDGYGFKNLQTRTKLLNGNMIIDSQKGKGTSVSIEIPYKIIAV